MIDDIRKAREKMESLTEAAVNADETLRNVEDTLEDVDRKMDRVERLERGLIATVDTKFEDLTLKMFVIELKLYGLVIFASLAVGIYLTAQGSELLGQAAFGLAGLVLISAFLTTYRYLGRDFIVDLIRIASPFLENPKLEKDYRIEDFSDDRRRR